MERIFVTVRTRPLSSEDAKASPWRILGNTITLCGQPAKFEFDRIFSEECKTTEIYEARTKEIVASVVRGFNGTVFAYGQTNSGKTYTMRGSETELGIITLAVRDLFQIMQEDMEREFLVRMSYMEIYNEEINDLLAPEHRRLQIHENFERGIYVAGLREEIISSCEQVLEFMKFGESHRHIGETNMNLYSSRSHTIFRMVVESRKKYEDPDAYYSCDAIRVSVLNLVDLAGSERAAKTGAEGMRLKEGSHINKSLMTLGTVIKKLSEGAESQGGYVPYRDSKLTRILQPALGGNSNTAIICTITLAQIHMDETKSSLQFASRALQVKNCACVNEILTDAALLKRQRKEIEELRAKLLGSHADHLEEEILNLRNTLLQSELEKERIVLELEEEKKAKVLRERRLQEQAKKIANLSSLVLCSERDQKDTNASKNKRRVTWCPGPSQRSTNEDSSPPCASADKTLDNTKLALNVQVPFNELLEETETSGEDNYIGCHLSSDNVCKTENFHLPDAQALLHVTSRRKANSKRRSTSVESNESGEVSPEFGAPFFEDVQLENASFHLQGLTMRESEAILKIKRLEDEIKALELEKLSMQRNLDDVINFAAKQNTSFGEQYEALRQDGLHEKEESKAAFELYPVSFGAYEDSCVGSLEELHMEIEKIVSEVDGLKNTCNNCIPLLEDSLQSLTSQSIVIQELKSFALEHVKQFNGIVDGHNKLHDHMRSKMTELLHQKKLLHEHCVNYQQEIENLKSEQSHHEIAAKDRDLQNELEKDELVSVVSHLQKEVLSLSSSTLLRERDALRKELDKTKSKLKDTESKLKTSIQEKIKLEGERAQAEREIKQLHGQKALLERDILKRDTLHDRRQETSRSDQSKLKEYNTSADYFPQDYRRLEHHASEMEAMIDSMKEALEATIEEKEKVVSQGEILASDLRNNLKDAESKIETLLSEVSGLKTKLLESELFSGKLEASLESVVREKEEMENLLTDALLEVEVEKAAFLAKDKALCECKGNLEASNAEILELSKYLKEQISNLEVLTSEHLHATEELQRLRDQLKIFTEEQGKEKDAAPECPNSDEDHYLIDQKEALSQNKSLEISIDEAEKIRRYETMLSKAHLDLEESARKISTMESKMHEQYMKENAECTMLRMRLQSMQAKLDMYRERYKESIEEMRVMNEKYKEASNKLKKQLGTYGVEILRLKKQLALSIPTDA